MRKFGYEDLTKEQCKEIGEFIKLMNPIIDFFEKLNPPCDDEIFTKIVLLRLAGEKCIIEKYRKQEK